jgi:hypothetical protein
METERNRCVDGKIGSNVSEVVMATATQPLSPIQQRVRHPLQRLRGYLRTYVTLEGAASFIVFLALWFWIGLLLDYGLFKLLNWDLVRIFPMWVRAVLLFGLASAAIALALTRVLRRLMRQFGDAAFALLLERKFPSLLGDRLITAVELSDPEAAAALGYSPQMIRETINEAAARVEKVPVSEVFDWRRLYFRGFLVLVLTLGFYGLALAGFAFLTGKTRSHGARNFHDASLRWFQRNVLLQYRPWPHRTQLVQLEPDVDHLKMSRDDPWPEVKVLAIKYAISADREPEKYPDGWRALTWADLEKDHDLLGIDLPGAPPGDWQPRQGETSLWLDQVETKLNKFDVRKEVAGRTLTARWNIADPQVDGGYRALRWSDLSPEAIGGFDVPQLSPAWDAGAEPAYIASAIGFLGLKMGPFLAGGIAVHGPHFTDTTLDEVEQRLAKIEGDESYLIFLNRVLVEKSGKNTKEYDRDKASIAVATAFGLGTTGSTIPSAITIAPLREWKIQLGDLRAILNRMEHLTRLRTVVDAVGERAQDPSMSRTLRELTVPKKVFLVAKGANNRLRLPLDNDSTNVYSGTLKDIKLEETKYWAEAEDYETEAHKVTVLPPPVLSELICEQYYPAYLYYRPLQGTDGRDLRGKKQAIKPFSLECAAGNVTKLTRVPVGSDVVLKGKVNEPIADKPVAGRAPIDGLTIVPREGSVLHYKDLTRQGDRFEVTFTDIREAQQFTFVFYDSNGVRGARQVDISVEEDKPPEVDAQPEIVRRIGPNTYKVTAKARIPFHGIVKDDQGLAQVSYAYSLKADKIGGAAMGEEIKVFGVALKLKEVEEPLGETKYRPINSFAKAIRDKELSDAPFMAPANILTELNTKHSSAFRKLASRFDIKPDDWIHALNEKTEPDRSKWTYPKADDDKLAPVECDFPLFALGLAPREGKPQQPYTLTLWVAALDTDIESDVDASGVPRPHMGQTQEKLKFKIVSENDLLVEIGKEEEELRKKFDEMFETLLVREAKLVEVVSKLERGDFKSAQPGREIIQADLMAEIDGLMGNVGLTEQFLEKSQALCVSMRTDFERILKEYRINDIKDDQLNRVSRDIIEPLREVTEREFPAARESLKSFNSSLVRARSMNNVAMITDSTKNAARDAQKKVADLKEKLRLIGESMNKVSGINELIKALVRLEQEALLEQRAMEAHKKKLIDDEIRKLLGDPEKK